MSGLFRPPDETIVYVASEAAKQKGYTDTTKEATIKSMIQAFNKTGAVELMIEGLIAVQGKEKAM